MRPCIVLLTALLTAAAISCHASSDRLTEHQLQLTPPPEGALLGSSDGPERVSGYFRLNREHTDDAEMFYMFFQNRNKSTNAPLVIWLTGGPGCSSELAVFAENGPFEIGRGGEVTERKYGWDVESDLLYVDQPLNVGFSYSSDPSDRISTEEQVSADLLDFMQVFLKARPHLASNDFYITGESYAGHYIPATAAAFVKANADPNNMDKINLKGVAIGNGLTDVENQFGTYAAFASAKGLISATAASGIQAAWLPCKLGIQGCNAGIPLVCDLARFYCTASQFAPVVALSGGVNIYDIRKKCVGPLCYDFSRIDDYLNDPETLKKLGVKPGRTWQECDMTVNADFGSDMFKNYAPQVTFLLESGLPVLIYAGTEDLICNDLGQDLWTKALPWSGRNAFNAAGSLEWRVNDDIVGTIKTAKNFTHASVLNAGHMVPMDQPETMLALFKAFVTGQDMESLTTGEEAATPSEGGARISWRRAQVTV